MFTTRTWLAPAAITIGLLAPTAHSFSLFDLFKPNHQKTFQQHAPADTVFYAESEYNLDQFPTIGNVQAYRLQMEILLKQLSNETDSIDNSMIEALNLLFSEYFNAMEKGTAAFTEHYGLADNLAYAMYMDGLYPVIHVALRKDNQNFAERISDALKGTNSTTEVIEIQGKPVHRMVIEHEQWPVGVSLAWLQEGTLGTVALVDFTQGEDRVADVLAIKPEQNSLYDAKTISNLRKRYAYSDESAGFFDIVNLTTSLVDPNSTKMAKDLLARKAIDFELADNKTCQAEFINLAKQMPRLAFGTTGYGATPTSVDASYQLTLELTDSEITTDLSALNGYLANHALNASDNIFGLAIGTDFAQLAPVFGKIWNQLTSADVSCDQLIEFQDALIVANPLASLQAAAMLNGIKGYAVSLFDIAFDANLQPIEFDGLVTITADNPMLFVNLAKSFLPFPDLNTIVEGKEIEIAVPDESIEKIFVYVSGKHIGIYTGNKGRTAFAAEVESSEGKQGLLGFSVNYNNYARIAEPLLDQFSGVVMDDYETCLSSKLAYMTIEGINGEFSYLTSFDANGITTDIDVNMGVIANLAQGDITGSYKVETLTDYCEWESFGDETISPNNTGYYDIIYAGDNCAFERYGYEWTIDGAALNVQDNAYFSRETCDADWIADNSDLESLESSGYSCTILTSTTDGFICSIPYEESYDLYRYTKQ